MAEHFSLGETGVLGMEAGAGDKISVKISFANRYRYQSRQPHAITLMNAPLV